MTNFNSVVAHFDSEALHGRIEALEGGRGFMRVFLDWSQASFTPTPDMECVLEMHDGGRFRMAITERLAAAPDGQSGELRMKLLGRSK